MPVSSHSIPEAGAKLPTEPIYIWGFPVGSDSKESARNVRDLCSILGQEDPLEKRMATHSSILVKIIPRTEELGRLQSVGSQRVGHD